MKKLFRKNQMIITTLAIIIAVAGYVNYSGKFDSASGSKTKTVSNTAKETAGEVTDDITDVGEAVLTNAQVSSYVAKAKLEREQTHSKAKDTLEEIISDDSVKDSVKQDAVVDVLVNKKDLSKVERSQIEDIIVRKTGCQLDKIVIKSIKTED